MSKDVQREPRQMTLSALPRAPQAQPKNRLIPFRSGYDLDSRAKAILTGLGIGPTDFDNPFEVGVMGRQGQSDSLAAAEMTQAGMVSRCWPRAASTSWGSTAASITSCVIAAFGRRRRPWRISRQSANDRELWTTSRSTRSQLAI